MRSDYKTAMEMIGYPSKMKNKAAQSLAKLRWARIPKEERAQYMPKHTGPGRPRIYPQCPKYRAHQFGKGNACPCGYERSLTSTGTFSRSR